MQGVLLQFKPENELGCKLAAIELFRLSSCYNFVKAKTT